MTPDFPLFCQCYTPDVSSVFRIVLSLVLLDADVLCSDEQVLCSRAGSSVHALHNRHATDIQALMRENRPIPLSIN